jgi:dephospho-CoA kinase
MLLVGLTGGIGSGKTTVAGMLRERGAVILSADAFAREAVAAGTSGFAAAVALFGPEVVAPDGELDRPAIAKRVFADPELRAALEDIVHPEVRRRIAEGVAGEAGSDRVVVVDSPLLIETGAHRGFPVVVVVSASTATQIARLAARGMDEEDARARLAAQMPLEEKAAVADVLLDNEGTEVELEAQVDRLWADLSVRAAQA